MDWELANGWTICITGYQETETDWIDVYAGYDPLSLAFYAPPFFDLQGRFGGAG